MNLTVIKERSVRLLSLTVLVGAVLVSSSGYVLAQDEPEEQVQRQEEDRKGEVKLEAEEEIKQPRKTLKGERITGPIDLLVMERKAESRKKLDAQIVRLKELLKITRAGDARRGEILFNLAEAYWEKSKSYNQEIFEKQDECYDFRDAGDSVSEKRCLQTMSDIKMESDRLRKESIGLYVEIVNNYTEFERMDSVLYYLGANLQEIGKKDQALEMFKRLATEFTNSRFIPNVLLAFGDHYFDKGDMEDALRAYQKVRAYPDSPIFAYARYKEAWCEFNLDGMDKALATFLDVLKLAKKSKADTAKGLINQTKKDIVVTYSFIGSPDKAIPFFKRISDDNVGWIELAERLAILYSDKGKPDESTALYQQLIQANKNSYKVVEYQYEVVRNIVLVSAYSEHLVREIIALLKLVQYADQGKFKEMDTAAYASTKDKVEGFVRNRAMLYHREAQKTKSDTLYGMSYILYQHYLETFPNGPKAYEMTFFYGELLYRVQKWKDAAGAYERAIEMEPKGKYTNEAVHGLVLAYFKLVNISEEKKDLAANASAMMTTAVDDPNKKGGTPKVPKPAEIPELQQKLIKAGELYSELNPTGKEIVDVKYTIARTYYEYDHHDKAIPLFKEIAYKHSSDPLAVVSANLELDAYNIIQDYDGLEREVNEFIEKRPIQNEEFITQLQSLGSSIRFKRCAVYDEKEKWREAALCFVSFFRSFPSSEHVDKALYNAALDFERMKDLGKAIKVRIFLLQSRPKSPLAPKTLYNIAANYHALAIYSEAAKYYETYADKYRTDEDAKGALANAANFRQGLGEYEQAILDNQKYLSRYGKRDPKVAADIYYQIGTIRDLMGDKDAAYEHYRRYIRKYGKKGSADNLLQAHVKIGLYFWNRAGWRSRADALKQFKNTLKVYNRMGNKTKEELTTGLDAVAQAQFLIGEDVFQEMARMKLDSKNEKQLQKKYKEKDAVAKKAQAIFEKVVDYKRPDWAIAALYRVGTAYENFANAMRKSPPPPRLSYDQKEIYRGLLEDLASQVETTAVSSYKLALQVATQASWFNEYSEKAERALSQLRPQEYRTPSEKRARPDNLLVGVAKAEFIKSVEDEDRLSDMESTGVVEAEADAAKDTEETLEDK